jgi:hypothetical protein
MVASLNVDRLPIASGVIAALGEFWLGASKMKAI